MGAKESQEIFDSRVEAIGVRAGPNWCEPLDSFKCETTIAVQRASERLSSGLVLNVNSLFDA